MYLKMKRFYFACFAYFFCFNGSPLRLKNFGIFSDFTPCYI